MKKQEILIYLKKREEETWRKLVAAEESDFTRAKKLIAEWLLLFSITDDLKILDLKVDGQSH